MNEYILNKYVIYWWPNRSKIITKIDDIIINSIDEIVMNHSKKLSIWIPLNWTKFWSYLPHPGSSLITRVRFFIVLLDFYGAIIIKYYDFSTNSMWWHTLRKPPSEKKPLARSQGKSKGKLKMVKRLKSMCEECVESRGLWQNNRKTDSMLQTPFGNRLR